MFTFRVLKTIEREETRFNLSRARRKLELQQPLSKWIDDFLVSRRISRKRFGLLLGLHVKRIDVNIYHGYSLSTMALVLEKAPTVFSLTEQETERLSDAVCETFNQQFSEGKKMLDYNPRANLDAQGYLPCMTYTGGQAARFLGISRETVRLQRAKLGIEHTLLTEADLGAIRENLRKSYMRKYFRGNAPKQ